MPEMDTAVRPSLRARFRSLYELPPADGRTPALEGLRGLAIVLVFFVHYHSLFGDYVEVNPVSHFISQFLGVIGHCGVDLFFVLSGFLIYRIVLRKRASYLQFMRRRIQRIYPAFATIFVVYVALSYFVLDESK